MTDTILVLDDNKANREIVKDVLRIEGYDVEAFAKPELALARLPDIDPEAFVVDFHLPRMNGLDFARAAVEANKANVHKLFLFVTGDASLDDEADISFLKRAQIMLKPIRLKGLLEAIRAS